MAYITSKSSALKMERIESSETSANKNQTPGKHPKDSTLNIKDGESIKSRKQTGCFNVVSQLSGVAQKFGEWHQKTNKTEDTNTLILLAFKIIAILHNTLLATFIKLLETVSKGLFRD
jgi:hypothetical protein